MNNLPDRPEEDWYSPLSAQKKEAAAPKRKKKRRSGVWRFVFWTLLAVCLITGTSLYFSDRTWQSGRERPALIMPTPHGEEPRDGDAEDGRDGGSLIPNWIQPEEDRPETDYPQDWRDFFDSYFLSGDEQIKEPRIPKLGESVNWQIELAPAGERELSLQEIYRSCAPSIVAIKSFKSGQPGYYWGTGIIMREDGLILTNAHLLEDCDSATVILSDNTSYEAKLVGCDSISDIAVLKIDARGLSPVVFGDSDALTVGERVAAIGNPLSEEFRATLTDGIVSAIDRGVSYNGRSLNLIQTNTAINEGNSGGALFNMFGQVVGVTNMKMMSSYSSVEGIGFAIPSATVRSMANALIRDGAVLGRTAVGITVGPVEDTAAEHYELPDGLYVSAVSEGSDAKAQGLREGDIITAVNGAPCLSTDDIVRVKDALSVGDSITFTVWRDGESFDVDVRLVDQNDVY